MSTTPSFYGTPLRGGAVISTANTNRDGTGTLGTVIPAVSSDARISRIAIKALSTTTNGMVRLFINDGTNARLVHEVAVTAATPSGTTKSFASILSEMIDTDLLPILLATGESLQAGTHNAESFYVSAWGGRT